jgi:hypothetical protein
LSKFFGGTEKTGNKEIDKKPDTKDKALPATAAKK